MKETVLDTSSTHKPIICKNHIPRNVEMCNNHVTFGRVLTCHALLPNNSFLLVLAMLALLILTVIHWISVYSEESSSSLSESACFLEKKRRSSPRGYYGGVGYPSFAEPIAILAGLAFLAYIIQTFHSVYYNTHHGLGGGLLTPKRKVFRKARKRSKRN